MKKISTVLAAAALAALPMMASAVTVNTDISLGDAPSVPAAVAPTDSGATFNFTALDRFAVDEISLTANGSNSGQDILGSSYSVLVNGLTTLAPTAFSNVISFGTQGIGFAFVPGGIFNTGDVFTVVFDENSPRALSYTVSFTTSPIPVPAAGLLLLTALGGAAALRRRKTAAAA